MKPLLIATLTGLMALSAAASAEDFPKRKPGLWTTTMNTGSPNMPVIETKSCIDAASDAELFRHGAGASANACTRREMHRDGDTVIIDSECTFGPRKMISHGVLTFSGDTAYHGEFKTRSEPPTPGGADRTSVQDAKWVGPCPADMKPGDTIGPNGMKMNLLDSMKNKN